MCARIDQAAQPGENRARCLPLCAPLYFSCGLHTTHGCCSGVTHQHGGLISLRGAMHCKHAPHPPAHRGCLLTQALFAPTPSPSCSIPVPKVCPQMSPLPLICSPLCCPRPHRAWGSHSTRALLHSSSPCPCGCVPSVPISWESQSPPPSQHQAVTVAFRESSPVQDQHNKRIRVRRAEIQKNNPSLPFHFPLVRAGNMAADMALVLIAGLKLQPGCCTGHSLAGRGAVMVLCHQILHWVPRPH